MRSTDKVLTLMAAAALVLGSTSCSDSRTAGKDSGAAPFPHLAQHEGSLMRSFSSLQEVADSASSLAKLVPTGRTSAVPLPAEHGGTEDSAPTVFIEMRVQSVLAGTLTSDVINVVDPGEDETTGQSALLAAGPHLVYLAPAVYDRDAPVGGYVIVGGSAGWYAPAGNPEDLVRVDDLFDRLPTTVESDASGMPKPRRSERNLIASGGY